MSPYATARCQMPAADCPRLATVEFAGRRLCYLCAEALARIGMDARVKPRPVGQWRGTAA